MANLDVNSQVTVRKDLIVDNFYGGLRFHNGMAKHKGKTTKIIGRPHYNKNLYAIEIDTEGYDWSKEMLEEV